VYISTLLQRNGQLNHQRKIHISARPVNDVLPYYVVLFQILTYVYMANFDIYRRRECSSTRLYSSGWVLSSQLWRIVNNYFTNESETDRLTAIAGWVQCWQREHVMHNVQLIKEWSTANTPGTRDWNVDIFTKPAPKLASRSICVWSNTDDVDAVDDDVHYQGLRQSVSCRSRPWRHQSPSNIRRPAALRLDAAAI